MSEELKNFLRKNGTASNRMTAYNPQSNGQVEWLNGTFRGTIALAAQSKNVPQPVGDCPSVLPLLQPISAVHILPLANACLPMVRNPRRLCRRELMRIGSGRMTFLVMSYSSPRTVC